MSLCLQISLQKAVKLYDDPIFCLFMLFSFGWPCLCTPALTALSETLELDVRFVVRVLTLMGPSLMICPSLAMLSYS